MFLRGIVVEDFCNYKYPSMFLVSTTCDWKCCKEIGEDTNLCQNSALASAPVVEIKDEDILRMFSKNTITKAVVIGGLEPFLQFDEIDNLITLFRKNGVYCDFVIYTGYYPEEIQDKITILQKHWTEWRGNIYVKFGRYTPHSTPIYDSLLGVTLASSNQFSMRIV